MAGTKMNKEQILEALKECEASLKLAHKRLDELGTENKVLKELVHHLASRPAPYAPQISRTSETIRIL